MPFPSQNLHTREGPSNPGMALADNGGTVSAELLHVHGRRFTDRTTPAWLVSRGIRVLAACATAAVFTTPVVYVFKDALANNAEGVRMMAHDGSFWSSAGTTASLTLGATAIAVVLGTSLAWFSHCLPPRRRWLGLLPLVPLITPHVALVLGYVFLLSPSVGYLNSALRTIPPFRGLENGPVDVYTVPWMIIILGLSLSSYMFIFVRSSLAQLHQELIDAASACGGNSLTVFWRVVVPLTRPAIVYGTLTVTVLSFGQFTIPLILGTQTNISVLTTQIYQKINLFPPNYGVASAYGLPILVAGVIFLCFQQGMLRRQERFIMAGGRNNRPLSHNGLPAQAALLAFGLFAAVLPVGALILVSLQPFWSRHIQVSQFALVNFQTVLDRQDLLSAIENSVTFALGAVVLTIPVSIVCARVIYLRRHSPLFAAVQELIVSLPLGIPAVIFGIGFLAMYLESPIALYGKAAGMILLYATMMIPFATRLLLVAMTNLGHEHQEAASAHGAGWLRRLTAIDIPLLRPALGSVSCLIVIMVTQEFSASMLVRSRDTQVMGTVLYDLFEYGSYPQTAVMALLMCVVTGVGVGLALLLGGRTVLRGAVK